MQSMTSLFLSQSYQDAWGNYIRSLRCPSFICWDFVILTASDERQAEGYRTQLSWRLEEGYLPDRTQYAVVADPDGKRVGSGGATLNALRYVREQTAEYANKRILVIHSGGDSKRVPQYSALGKLFSPVPHVLPDGRLSTLFDELMVSFSGVPGRIPSGMLAASGDVLLLWNPLQMDVSGRGAAVISFKEDVETGQHHGVYRIGADGCVAEFLHKQSPQMLRERGAVNSRGRVDIDTGAVLLSKEILMAMEELLSEAYINERVCLSLYGDFLYPMASGSTLEGFYRQEPEGSFCQELTVARTMVWRVFRPFRMKLLRMAPAKFLHFGTSREILELMTRSIGEYFHLGWSYQVGSCVWNPEVAAYNSILEEGAMCGQGSYLECSYVHSGVKLGHHVIVSHVELEDVVVPDNVILHGLRLEDGRYVVRIFGIEDNPKENRLFGVLLPETSLWESPLYSVCNTMKEAVVAALQVYESIHSDGERLSLKTSFARADVAAVIDWDRHMQECVQMERLWKALQEGRPAELLEMNQLTEDQQRWLARRLEGCTSEEQIRLYYYVGRALGGTQGEVYMDRSFAAVRAGMLEYIWIREHTECRMTLDTYTVQLPLRVNWGGGWTDTPPYCQECGGAVLNAAIRLQGKRPVQVTLRRLPELKIVFDSRDMDNHGEFTNIQELQSWGNPYDPFALQKAALLVCGVIPMKGGCLREVLARLGGGLFLSTEVTGVPKGSGLGTSSILAAACIKGLSEFLGIVRNEKDICDRVLCMEQLMSTGGGWQDQMGGLYPGIKWITSHTGIRQELTVEPVELSSETARELQERFVLVYTGQRRLARHQLREVMGRYIGRDLVTLETLEQIKRLGALMNYELRYGSVDGFAGLLSRHWELSKKLDIGCTNTCIDQIFLSMEDLIDGKMICGAGGGGFLQIILKKGVTREMLRARLQEVFQDSGVDVWNCELEL